MDSFNDLQQLWQEAAPRPGTSAQALIASVRKERRRLLLRTWASVAALLLTIPVLIWIFMAYHPVYATTRLSIVLCLLAIAGGIAMQSAAMRTLLLPVRADMDNRAMIAALQRLQRKNKRINTTYITAYFLALSAAMGMYLFEFVRGNLWFAVVSYSLTFGWIAFAWCYLRPRAIRKQNAALDKMIGHLRSLQEELESH